MWFSIKHSMRIEDTYESVDIYLELVALRIVPALISASSASAVIRLGS